MRRWAAEHPLASFFVLALFLSWLGWAPLAAEALSLVDSQPTQYLHLLGGLGPALAALVVTAGVEGRTGIAPSGSASPSSATAGAGSRFRRHRHSESIRKEEVDRLGTGTARRPGPL